MPPRHSHDSQAPTSYVGARLNAISGGNATAPQAARVGAFVQGLMAARGSCARAGDVARLFRDIEGGNSNTAAPLTAAEEEALSRLIADANAALEPMQLAVKRVTLPEPSAAGRGGRGGGGGRAATDNGDENGDNGDENGDNGEDGENENDENEDRPRPLDAAGAPSVAAGSSHHLSRSFYGVVNVEPDPVALANGWGLSPALLAYLRAVLERMVKASDTPCGCVALETLLNIDHAADAVAAVSAAAQRAAAAALEGGGGNDSDDSGGRRAGDDERAGSPAAAAEARLRRANAAAAAARAGAGQPPPALKRAERAPALQTLAECGWLARGNPPPSRAPSASSVVSYGIGPRSFMELGELLRSFEPSPEVLAAWAAQL